MQTIELLKNKFASNGFVLVRQFLTGDKLRELCHELNRYIRDVVPGLPSEDAFYQDRNRPETLKQMQRMGRDAFFQQYREEPSWTQLASELLGEACSAHEPEWFNKPPGTEHPTPPHQDNYYFCLAPPQVLTMWLALDHVDSDNGGLCYVAGSHKLGLRPHGSTEVLGFSQGITDYSDEDRSQEIGAVLEPGDMVIHHGHTIHRAEPNFTRHRHRRAFAMVFEGESCRKDPEAFARYQSAVKQQHQQLGSAEA